MSMFPAVATVYGLGSNQGNSGLLATLALDQPVIGASSPLCSSSIPSCSNHLPSSAPDNCVTLDHQIKPIETILANMKTSDPIIKAVINNVTGKLPLKKPPLMCDVCNIELSSKIVVAQHNLGSKHRKKVALKALQNQTTNISSEDTLPLSFTCDMCKVTVNSEEQLNLHQSGKLHLKKMAAHTFLNESSSNNPDNPKESELPQGIVKTKSADGIDVFQCFYCNKFVNSRDQLSQHIVSKKHVNKIRNPSRFYPYTKNTNNNNRNMINKKDIYFNFIKCLPEKDQCPKFLNKSLVNTANDVPDSSTFSTIYPIYDASINSSGTFGFNTLAQCNTWNNRNNTDASSNKWRSNNCNGYCNITNRGAPTHHHSQNIAGNNNIRFGSNGLDRFNLTQPSKSTSLVGLYIPTTKC